jgi:hypothetical protein
MAKLVPDPGALPEEGKNCVESTDIFFTERHPRDRSERIRPGLLALERPYIAAAGLAFPPVMIINTLPRLASTPRPFGNGVCHQSGQIRMFSDCIRIQIELRFGPYRLKRFGGHETDD